MKIQSLSQSANRATSSRKDKQTLSIFRLIIIVLVTSFLLSIFFNRLADEYFPYGVKAKLWNKAHSYGFANLNEDIKLRSALKHAPRYISNMLGNTDLPKISIDIKFKHLQKLDTKRLQAIKNGFLSTSADDYVPAEISTNEKTIKVKLRLKGDNIDHLNSNKWSMRIHTKGKSHLFGLRRFSIQHPKARGFQGEVLFHETQRLFNVLTPNYFFVDVLLNGNSVGVMAVEEHFSKEVLERNGRKEGVIVKFDESDLWAAKDFANSGPFKTSPFQSYLNTNIDTFQSSKIQKSEALSKQYGIAVGLLRGFMDDSLKTSEVFDVKALGSYLGVSEFWGAEHEILWPNLRFYLNPLTMKLEPIAFDAALQLRIHAGETNSHQPIIHKMLQDPEVEKVFRNTLEELVAKVEDGSLIKQLKKVEAPLLKNLNTEFFMLEAFNYEELKKRAEKVPGSKKPKLDLRKIPAYLNAHLIENEKGNYLEILSTIPTAVDVHSISWKDKADNLIPFEPINTINYPIVLKETKVGDLPSSLRINYEHLSADKDYVLVIKSSIRGYEKIKETTVQKYFASLDRSPMPKANIADQLSRHSFLSYSGSSTSIEVKPGQWQVNGDIVIPHNHELIINADTTLQFAEDRSLVVYGTTIFKGTKESPIILEGQGDSNYWDGIAIYQAPKRSNWTYVNVRNTTGMSWPLWSLTGGTTFNQSDIDMSNCTFSGHKGEDALNIVHSDFNMQDIIIMNTTSDAFDSDFCTGSVYGGKFQDIGLEGGGDGIDVSGSKVTVDGTIFIRVNDKAISVGEGSELIAQNILVEDSGVGAASKDKSRLEINDSTIKKAHNAALMSYTKKPEYGPAAILASNIKIIDTHYQAKVQTGNSITLNGKVIQSEDLDVENLYQTTMKGSRK